ncbi:hypothetical protein FG386_000204 [Cryptosporidium ryanae]|uniref:uncharacterized protein n=1 Tax=Cryptosporidium ryanae TaxID=515981 RepID=UPI003519D818|nr:hypothetical protein FG386_000204 [Cryptosporidium ryanae]
MKVKNLRSTKLEEIAFLPEEEDILIWKMKTLKESSGMNVEASTCGDKKFDMRSKSLKEHDLRANRDEKQLRLINKCNSMPDESKRSVFDRLLDHRLYTGIHKYRFDKDGNGLGKAGREYVYNEDGYTESNKRKHEVVCSPIRKHSYANLGQIDSLQKAKVIWLYKNGDKYDNGTIYYIKPYIRTMPQLFNEINRNLRLLGGPVRLLFDQGLKQINNVNEIVDGAKYLCTSGEQPTSVDKLEKFLSYWIINH